MAKEEPHRLFSKVAKFVRNPLKDWSELEDAPDAAVPETGYSREMLKDMIERRQRNDFVRRREFDMLRKLRQREAAGGHDAAGNPSSFNVNSSTGKTDGRALTLKKIDEIEEQMSHQWWKNRQAGADAARQGGEDLAAHHARAYADTVPGSAPPAGQAAGDRGAGAGTVEGDRHSALVGGSAIEEASIRFAHGDDTGAEFILLQALSPDMSTAQHDDTWRALLDLYRATGDAERFEATAAQYAQRVNRPAPQWMSLRALASDAQAAMAAAPEAPRRGGADWSSPAQLTRPNLAELTRALGAAGAVWTLDWSGLAAIDIDAAGPLRALFAHWAGTPAHLRFIGSDRLLTVLEEATPVSERGKEVIWWQLRMDAMRVMHLADAFELVALNYCITYEVSPPPWEDPQGRFESLSGDAAAATPALPFGVDDDALPQPARAGTRAALAGELSGESHSTWARLDAELADETTPTISCAALVRIDFAAAGTLLNWVMARDARGERVHFVDAHRLIGPFFNVIGIADHSTVALRQD